ncbi:MAG: nicotinate (nicotinamide) nucleotide adenylyltransferase [Paludibacteraceae bacterium]|nr:nicotinate (nicotinamide) nucleotide adenylyltransferase [Paludibacteraceae bacterium]
MTGLFFGSFNPVHLGHLALAKYLLEHTALEEIWFVVSPQNPLKQDAGLLPDSLRLQLVNLAIAEEKKMKGCDVEFSLPKPSYTIHTLEHLQKRYPQKEFTLIIGADNLALFHRWKDYELILAKYPLLVYPREGVDLAPLHLRYPQVQLEVGAPLYSISSTQIRELIREKKEAGLWLHPLVYKAVLDKRLYL